MTQFLIVANAPTSSDGAQHRIWLRPGTLVRAIDAESGEPSDRLVVLNASRLEVAELNTATVTVQQIELEATLFAFLCRKYVQRNDARQGAMGLQYTTAETHDLAAQLARFLSPPARIVD